MKKIFLIDNYDSFTYNLSHYLEELGCKVVTKRNDMFDINEIKDDSNAEKLRLSEGEVKFEKVSFEYQKNDLQILKSINLKIPGKKMTSLVGHSGAGKSTILNLIPRFYNIHSGDIKIDDQSIYKSTIQTPLNKYQQILQLFLLMT